MESIAVNRRDAKAIERESDRFADALAMVRSEGVSLSTAAKRVGVSGLQLTRLFHAADSGPDQTAVATAADQHLLELNQSLSILATERIIERVQIEGDRMPITHLTKIYKSASDLVATKQQWARGTSPPAAENGFAALAKVLADSEITIKKRDPAEDAVDVSPRNQT